MNKLVVVVGRPGVDPLAHIGPFDTEEEATKHAAQHESAYIDILIDPANLPEPV